jgi:copper homeostasis protein
MTMLEICVDTIEGVLAAKRGGATRVELCASLSEGGLTPSVGLMKSAAASDIPCFAMIRPRSGMFHFSKMEENIMLADIQAAKDTGLAGVVLGAQGHDGALNLALLTRLVQAAGDMGKTLHRVIDVVPDTLLAVDQAIALGFDRILTSGAQPEACDGVEMIAQMVARAQGRLSIMPGCGLTPANVADVVKKTGACEVHASCNAPVPTAIAFSDFYPPNGLMMTSEAETRLFVEKLQTPER